MPDKRPHYLALAVGLTTLLVAFLLTVNAHYLFHSTLYEDDDLAANSLCVLRAGHFHELYGQYSRWGFHHPGPAVMYAFALGEWLLYRVFHLVPTPYNAQVIVLMVLVCSFLAGGICVAARWVRSPVFVPLTLGLAALHFTAADPHTWVLCTWMPFVMVMLFFGLLMAAASVGAGQGDDLPLLVLAGGFMIHTHVAQPLFVGPMFLLAYAGLAWACRRPAGVVLPAGEGNEPVKTPVRATFPWRVYPWAHRFAVVLAAVFVLPMVVDLFRGSRSNAAKILLHMRTYHGQRQPWLDALYCFLRFGVYKPSQVGVSPISPSHVTEAQIGHFLHGHPEMATLWLCALLVPVLALACRWWMARPRPASSAGDTAVPSVAGVPVRSRWRFLGWLAAVWLLAAGLTIVWGHIQDGEMFYFNSWFTYGVYFVLAVLAAGAVSDLVETVAARKRRPGLWTSLAGVLCLLAAAGFLYRHRGVYRESEYDNEVSRAAARTVDNALAARAEAPRAKLIVFSHDQWESAAAVVLHLARGGTPCFVPPDWDVLFGEEHAPADLFSNWAANPNGELPMDIWHVVPGTSIHPLQAAQYPLVQGCALLPGIPMVDPALADAAITFAGEPHNSASFVLTGWSGADGTATYAWSEGKTGLIAFAPRPVSAEAVVEVGFYFSYPYLEAGKHDSQRLTMHFNGHDLGTLRVDRNTPKPLKISLPAAVWNQRASSLLVLGFPDAISPQAIGESNDARLLAFATEKITFRLVAAPAAPAQP